MGIFVLILALTLMAYASFMMLCIRAFGAIDLDKLPHNYHGKTSITVIIPARNEEKNIEDCIKSIQKQFYDGVIEILVINDHSTDNTALILEKFKNSITIIDWQDDNHEKAFKKKAITKAVELAKGDLIITTDADTIRGSKWVASIAHFYETENCKLIAAPVTYAPTNSIIGIFETVDFLMMQGISAAGLEYNFYHSCNGANLAYAKRTFQAVDGYSGTLEIPSGDDVFLLQKIDQKYKNGAKYLLNQEAIVTTFPLNNLRQFLQQRIRWAGKATAYKDKKSFWVLGITAFVNAGLIALSILCLLGHAKWIYFLFAFLLKVIPESILLHKTLGFFNRRKLFIWHWILQPIHWLYILFCGLVAPFASYKWKGRSGK
jgi:cellulose synthase/poly-beta-1,6-N-acetylglucosamine synthase-like glycosyltransferase